MDKAPGPNEVKEFVCAVTWTISIQKDGPGSVGVQWNREYIGCENRPVASVILDRLMLFA